MGVTTTTAVTTTSVVTTPTSSGGTPSATIKNGTVVGRYSPQYDQDFFLGVPYAQPPLGNLRFRNPQSINASFEGVYDATQYSTACVGYGVSMHQISLACYITNFWQSDQWPYAISEDCLYVLSY